MHAESAHTCLRTAAVAGVLTAALAALSVQAKTPRQMFETMPPELHPNSLTELPDSISPNTVRCKAADGTTMEITLLPPHSAAATPDTLFCLLTTRNTPEPETTCDIYGEDWQRVKSIPLTPFAASLTAKPDTMDLTEYSRLQKLIEMPLVEAHFTDKSPATLQLSLHVPLLGKEDRQRVKAILVRKECKMDDNELHIIDKNQ